MYCTISIVMGRALNVMLRKVVSLPPSKQGGLPDHFALEHGAALLSTHNQWVQDTGHSSSIVSPFGGPTLPSLIFAFQYAIAYNARNSIGNAMSLNRRISNVTYCLRPSVA